MGRAKEGYIRYLARESRGYREVFAFRALTPNLPP